MQFRHKNRVGCAEIEFRGFAEYGANAVGVEYGRADSKHNQGIVRVELKRAAKPFECCFHVLLDATSDIEAFSDGDHRIKVVAFGGALKHTNAVAKFFLTPRPSS